MLRRAVLFTCLLALTAVSAVAVPIVPTDLDTVLGVSSGPLFAGPITDSFVAPLGGALIGTAENNVYFNSTSGIYTYTHLVTPSINNISEFNTGFNVLGFNGVAGWSYSGSAAIGGPGDGTGYTVDLDPDGTIDWELDPHNTFWDAGEGLTFFFQSDQRPGLDAYNLVNGQVGTAISYAPAPEPSTYLLFGSALAFFAWRRKKSA